MKVFDYVKSSGYYKKICDGKYLVIQGDKVLACGSNDPDFPSFEVEIGEEVEKTYYEYVHKPVKGVIIGFTDLIVKGYIGTDHIDSIDTGLGVIPERDIYTKRAKETVKCAKVCYANNKTHYVPVDKLKFPFYA